MEGTALLGVDALIHILVSLASIAFSWWVLMGIRIEVLIRPGKTFQAKALMVLLSIGLGHQLATFLTDYLGWSRMIGALFH